MKITIDMPNVTGCQVSECAYNKDLKCHARAITVGDGVTPGCDTFFKSQSHVRDTSLMAGVGACKVSGCGHNKDFECSASSINVGFSGDDVHCLTYKPR